MKIPATHLLYKNILGEPGLAVSYSQIEAFKQCPYKWYKTYVEGNRFEERQEATSYGTVIHKTLEYFFRNNRLPTGEDLSAAINLYYFEEQIPFDSIENTLEALKDTGDLLAWLVRTFRRGTDGKYIVPDSELNSMEKLLRSAKIVGVEEDFVLPYRLPVPVNINGKLHTHVNITGSIDLHLSMKNGGNVYHYIVDWKSGRKLFDKNKIDTNLQHPIYSFYVMKEYKQGLPRMNLYVFTRTREYQMVKVDEKRKQDSIKDLNDTFRKMYDFDTKNVRRFTAFVEKSDKSGYTRKQATLKEPVPENMRPCPSALCYYCDFGLHKRNMCPFSSDWDPSKKKNK